MSGELIKNFLLGLGFQIDEAGMKSFQSAISKIGIQAAILDTAVVAAAGALFGTVQHIAGTYFELDKLATQFRTTASAVDEFIDVGTVLGLSEEETVGSLKALDKAIGETANNLGRAKMWFQATGQSVLDAGGKMRPTIDVMNELADKFSKMERGKALAVMEHLGLDPALLKLFNADLLTLRKEINDIEAAAGFNMADAIDQSKQYMLSWRSFTQEIEKIKLLFSKMVDVIAVRLMPRFRKSLDTLTGHIEEFRKKIMKHMVKIQSFIDGVIDKLLVIVEVVSLAATRLIQLVTNVVDKMIDLFSQLTGPQQAVVVGLGAIAAAWKFLNLSFLASPLGIILALAAAIGLLVDDFLVWRAGGKSLINWKEWEKGINAAMDGIIALRDLVGNAFMMMVDAVLVLKNLLCGDFSKAWESAGKVADHFLGIFTEGKKAFTNLGNAKEKFEGPMASLFSKGPSTFLMPPLHQAAASTGGGNPQISQTIDITVQGSNSPEATGKYVAREQMRVNADLVRNMKGAIQ